MPSPPWATPDQTEFLESRLPDFLEAQRNKTTLDFWKIIYRDFFEKWTDPQDEIPAATVPKKRKRQDLPTASNLSHTEWVQLRKSQINNWYNNRRNGVSPRRQIPAVVIGGSQPVHRILSEINLYSKRYYDIKVREQVAEAWRSSEGAPDKRSRIAIINKCINKCWQEETDEVKAEIRQEYERLRQFRDQHSPLSNPGSTTLTLEDYSANLLALPGTVQSFMTEMYKRTGFCFTIVAGGPDRHRPGRMRLFAFHEGLDRFGQKFGAAYPSFRPNVMDPFHKFLYNINGENKPGSQDQGDAKITSSNDPQNAPPVPSNLPSTNAMASSASAVATHSNAIPPDPLSVPSAGNISSIILSTSPSVQSPAPFDPTKVVFDNTPMQSVSQGSPLASVSTTSPSGPGLLATTALSQNSTETSSPPIALVNTNATSTKTILSEPNQSNPPSASSTGCSDLAGLVLDIPQGDINPDGPIFGGSHNPMAVVFDNTAAQGVAMGPDFTGEEFDLSDLDAFDFSYDEFANVLEQMKMEHVNEWDRPAAFSLTGTNANASLPEASFLDKLSSNISTPAPNIWASTGIDTPLPLTEGPRFTATEAVATPALTNVDIRQMPPAPLAEPVIAPTTMFTLPNSTGTDVVVQEKLNAPPALSDSAISSQASASAVLLAVATPALTDVDVFQMPPALAVPAKPATPPTTSLPSPASSSQASVSAVPLPNVSENRVVADQAISSDTLSLGTAEERSARVRKPPMSKEVQPAAWLDLAHAYLSKDLLNEKWTTCIEQWFSFEKDILNAMDTNSRRIPAKARPATLSKWLATRNYGIIPTIPDEAAFAAEWLQWWNDMQPKWRKSLLEHSLPLPIDPGNMKEDLSSIKKGGPTGLVTVLIGLKWWASRRAVDSGWESAVMDITDCLLYTGNAAPGKKKRHSKHF